MERIINVGIAGFGMSGQIFQAPFFHANPHFHIKKVYERSKELARAEYPYIQTVRSFEDLLTDDIDLVVISTPNAQHVPMARQAILAGKHVLVEKPVAATSREALELSELAKEKGVVLAVYQSRRLDGDFRTVQRLIGEGMLGDILDYTVHYDRYVTGRSKKPWKAAGGPTVNVLYDLGVHIIDQAYVLFGMPEEVYADFRKHRPESGEFDNFEVILYYGKRKVCLAAGEVVAMPGAHFRVNGEKGSFIKYGMDVQENALIAGKRPPMEHWGEDDPEMYGTLARVTESGIVQEKVPTVPGNYGLLHDNLYHAIVDGAPFMVNPEDTVAVLRIIEAALESGKTGARVKI